MPLGTEAVKNPASQKFGANLKRLVNIVVGALLFILSEYTYSSCFVVGISQIQQAVDINIENRISTLKGYRELRKEIKTFVKNKHGDQKYGGFPYTVHLALVEKTLIDFGFTPESDLIARKLLLSAWLHDAIEDTSATFAQIQKKYGTDIAHLVDSVTKVPKNPNLSKDLRTLKTMQKITQQHPLGPVLKLADRIANMSFGLKYEGRILPKYYGEWPSFKSTLYQDLGDPRIEAMWAHAGNLLGQ